MAMVRDYWTPLALSLILLAITLLVWASGDGVLGRTLTDAWIRAVLVVGLYIFIGNSGVLVFGHIAFTLIGYLLAWGALMFGIFHASHGQIGGYINPYEILVVAGCAVGTITS